MNLHNSREPCRSLGGLHDGGHGADQLPESLDRLSFASDVRPAAPGTITPLMGLADPATVAPLMGRADHGTMVSLMGPADPGTATPLMMPGR